MAHDVFISYSTKDKLAADAVCARLEGRGIRCWIAPRDILPGMDWGASIIEALESARLMVVVFSSNANASLQIRREVECAFSKEILVVPLRIEDVPPGRSCSDKGVRDPLPRVRLLWDAVPDSGVRTGS